MGCFIKLGCQKWAYLVIAENENQGPKPCDIIAKNLYIWSSTGEKNDDKGVEKTSLLIRNLFLKILIIDFFSVDS